MLPTTLIVVSIISLLGAYIAHNRILHYIPIFINRNLYGQDQCKKEKTKVPEPMGAIAAAVYSIIIFALIPFMFYEWMSINISELYPYMQLLSLLSAIISIWTAISLGFADDILDLRWRDKLLFPTFSSLPVLIVYHVSGHSTTVLLPNLIANYIGHQSINIGIFFYFYMGMLIVFCTNSINILAGINGIEASQGLIISITVAIYNIIQLIRGEGIQWHQTFSLAIILPFIAINYILYRFNRYPAKVFVGDTFCYWAGMTLAVVGILGHFPKTLLLFFIPQIFNFLFSIPQLFKWIPCPRHRLPKYDPNSDTLSMSKFTFTDKQTKFLGKFILKLFSIFGLIDLSITKKEDETMYEVNNFTILNLILKIFGPLHESELAKRFMYIQIVCSIVALFVRFYFAGFIYDIVH
uniref:UDP-N-acetylglucosamine--dolichyl-phosphate N-acetylglucosaminephosphotransferase n=1 Tax=Parastrongyloides trichosuri TaxID=131310 RepID=A0A0N4ZPV2_PARTI